MLLQALMVPAIKPFATAQQYMSHGRMQHKLPNPLAPRRHRRKDFFAYASHLLFQIITNYS